MKFLIEHFTGVLFVCLFVKVSLFKKSVSVDRACEHGRTHDGGGRGAGQSDLVVTEI